MNNIFLYIFLFIFVLLFINNYKNRENFNFTKLQNSVIQNSGMDSNNIVTTGNDILGSGGVSIANKNIDDNLLTSFIKKQLGKEDGPSLGGYDTQTDFLEYPKDKPTPKLPDKKMDYDDILETQKNEITRRRSIQNLTLRNLRYELLRIIELEKTIPEIKNSSKLIKNLNNQKKNNSQQNNIN